MEELVLTGDPIDLGALLRASRGASNGSWRVRLADDAWIRVRSAREALLAGTEAAYGLTTGLGAHAYGEGGGGKRGSGPADADPESSSHEDVIVAHATTLAPVPASLLEVRAAVVCWCNQACSRTGGVPGVSAELVASLLGWVNDRCSAAPMLDALEATDPGFGAIVVNCQLALQLLRASGARCRAGEALPLMSHSNLLAARCAVLAEELAALLRTSAAVGALSLAGFGGHPELFEDARRWTAASHFEAGGAADLAAWMRCGESGSSDASADSSGGGSDIGGGVDVAPQRWAPRRLQDPLDLRCMAGPLGTLAAALEGLKETLARLTACAQCNPVVLPRAGIGGAGSFEAGGQTSAHFDTTALRAGLGSVCTALGEACGRSHQRACTLASPHLNGGLPVGLSRPAVSTAGGGSVGGSGDGGSGGDRCGVHNRNLAVIGASLAHVALAAASHQPTGVSVWAADGVECAAAFSAQVQLLVQYLVQHLAQLLVQHLVWHLAQLLVQHLVWHLTQPATRARQGGLEALLQMVWTGSAGALGP